ncbi:MAG TPA: zf-HC2 domain-containing protein, partial [Thermoanaerobaculia bacterium]|nr:zf-HC2 domain-containing protein [Thermoanaerobaculia bacterium]
MSDPAEELLNTLGELAHRDRMERDHLTADELVAWQEGALPAAEAERAAEHLAACTECSALLLDLAELCNPASASAFPPPSEIEVAAVWRGVRERAGEGASPPA